MELVTVRSAGLRPFCAGQSGWEGGERRREEPPGSHPFAPLPSELALYGEVKALRSQHCLSLESL